MNVLKFVGIFSFAWIPQEYSNAADFNPFDKTRTRDFSNWRKKPVSIAEEQINELEQCLKTVKNNDGIKEAEVVAELRVLSQNPHVKSRALLLFASLVDQNHALERAEKGMQRALNDSHDEIKTAVSILAQALNNRRYNLIKSIHEENLKVSGLSCTKNSYSGNEFEPILEDNDAKLEEAFQKFKENKSIKMSVAEVEACVQQ